MTKNIQDIESGLIELASNVLDVAKTLNGKEQADALKTVVGFYTAYKKAHATKGAKAQDEDKRDSNSFTALQQKMNDIQKAH